MIPKKIKKIYLNNVDENGSDMQNREYIDLSQVWHDAREEPAGRDWRIICEDESGKCWVASRRDAFTIGYNWQEFTEDEALTRWAYIKDLLPKGGK